MTDSIGWQNERTFKQENVFLFGKPFQKQTRPVRSFKRVALISTFIRTNICLKNCSKNVTKKHELIDGYALDQHNSIIGSVG